MEDSFCMLSPCRNKADRYETKGENMSKLGYFLGGALIGAAGLVTTALLSEKLSDSGSAHSTGSDDAADLNADGLKVTAHRGLDKI
jgi:hypothetical protein